VPRERYRPTALLNAIQSHHISDDTAGRRRDKHPSGLRAQEADDPVLHDPNRAAVVRAVSLRDLRGQACANAGPDPNGTR
jgi:hypothetical protein